jgi:hypothetical protein
MNLKLSVFLFVALFIYSTTIFAQHDKNKTKALAVKPLSSIKAPTDTLQPASFATGTPTLYKSTDGGYCFGVNTYADRAFAQTYKVTTSYIVDGVALWIGAKKQVGAADTLSVIYYQPTGPGTDSSGAAIDAPDSIYRSVNIMVNQLDTGGVLTFVLFPDSAIALTDYALGIDISRMNDDTIGLVSTKNGDAHGTQLSWEKYSDDTWHSILEPTNWGWDLDLGIFAIVDESTANVNDDYFIDGMKLSQNQPNPAAGEALIQYEIQQNANITFEIYDISGKLIASYNEGNQTAGKHNITIDTEKINSGTYFYSLKADNRRLTKKMTVTK